MILAKNYETVIYEFVKVMPRIPPFSDTVTVCTVA